MAITVKQLGQSRPSGTTAVSLYSPASAIQTVIRNINIVNSSAGTAKARIFIDDNGTTYDETTALWFDVSLLANESLQIDAWWAMDDENGNLAIRTDTANALTFTANGTEFADADLSGSLFKQLGQLRPANTTAASLYSPAASTQTAIRSLVICNTSGSAVDARVFMDDNGTTFDQTTALFYDISLAADETLQIDNFWGMDDATGNLGVRTSVNDALTFTAFGPEYS